MTTVAVGAGPDDPVRARVAAVEAALADLESIADEHARGAAEAAVEGLLELYGEALRRLVAAVARSGGPPAVADVAADDLIGHLLLLHDIHPEPAEERVRRALDEVRPFLGSHGGDVELLSVADGVAHLRLDGSCNGCAGSTITLKLAIEDAIAKVAPDIIRVEADGVAEAGMGHAIPGDACATIPDVPGAFIPLGSIQRRPPGAAIAHG